ncbi:MAG: hypothetical protein C4519_15550 [Desulfobacteraceae bacterium]|nr:MAG: hypothetical protein C4519_15550 [Desulfobacteraceae bacterium]
MDLKKHVLMVTKVLAIFFLIHSISQAQPVNDNDLQVIKISPKNESAVIKVQKKEIKVVTVGDDLGNLGKVMEISKGRVVLQRNTENGNELILIRKETGEDQRVEKISKVQGLPPGLYMPGSAQSPAPAGNKIK